MIYDYGVSVMSRVININSVGKERTYLTKAIVAAIRELSTQTEAGLEAKDLVAFIILSLRIISGSIESSVQAWEKRDYWVKADRFRIEWAWTGNISEKMVYALEKDDWETITQLLVRIGQKLGKVNVSENNRLGTPWKGSWNELKKQISKNG
jgi:hypothetical protein